MRIMPGAIHSHEHSGEAKFDMLSMLQDSGVEFLVFTILHKLSLNDICSAMQVCSRWNSWDTEYFWDKELVALTKGRGELKSVIKDIDCPKSCIKTLWRLRQSWRQGRNRKVSLATESAVLSAACAETSVICGLNSGETVMYSMEDGTETRRKEMHSKGIKVVRVKNEELYTGSYDGSVKVRLEQLYFVDDNHLLIEDMGCELASPKDNCDISGRDRCCI